MVINQAITREQWRKLAASLRYVATIRHLPEYDEGHDSYVNKRYYR